MLKYCEGTVFNTEARTLVNTVNCFGVMGAGIALEFKLRYPEMFKDYKEKCDNKEYFVGRLRLYKYENDVWILNFPTKNHWKYPSKLKWIEDGLKYFAENYKKAQITSVAFPKLGTHNGGLEWQEVKLLMEKYLKHLDDIEVYICLDEKNDPEGIEKKMVESINEVSIEELTNNIKLTKKQANGIISNIPVKRFWVLSKSDGIGEKTYEKIFNYYYNKWKIKNINLDNQLINSDNLEEAEQITWF